LRFAGNIRFGSTSDAYSGLKARTTTAGGNRQTQIHDSQEKKEMSKAIYIIEGGVTSPAGFSAAGVHVGLRRKRRDLALLVSETDADCAAVFTTNVIKGAPIIWNREVLKKGSKIKAVVVNSAYANSGTGVPGLCHAREMAETTADCLNVESGQVLVASTGLIGVHLPIDTVKAGIKTTATYLGSNPENGTHAAEAITTTDTFIKQMAVQLEIDGKIVTLGAMAKGSGMVHPNMATTLGFLTTDLAIDASLLQKALSATIVDTFNMISVDGDTSTNDMVVIMANGLAGNAAITAEDENYNLFVQALHMVLMDMAKSVARDGEGSTKLIQVKLSGAETVEDARKLAKSVVASNLVKAAVFAEDANWGRIVAALGSAGVEFEYENLSIMMSSPDDENGELPLLVDGMPYWLDESLCREVLAAKEVTFRIIVGKGSAEAIAFGCDLTYDYIRKNGNYRAGQMLNQMLAGASRDVQLAPKVEYVKQEGVA
jgi:glutamate N-acetyltransferase / amino-acid N-acetyltransferase